MKTLNQSPARRNALKRVETAEAPAFPFDLADLSPTARVMVEADRSRGRLPRYHEGMSVKDAAIITGLPEDEAGRRVAKYRDNNDDHFRNLYLTQGAGERYQSEETQPKTPKQEIVPTAEIIQFPLPFGEETRAVSNPLARCALFAAVNEREYFKDWVTVLDTGDLKIEVKGEQLNQDDKDTFGQLVIMAQHKPFGSDVSVPANAALAGLGKHTRKEQRIQLFREIERQVTTSIRVTKKGEAVYTGHLLDDASTPLAQKLLPQHRRNITYRINPKLAYFFNPAFYTLYDQKERLKLGRNSLAKWLHLWIISHAEQYPHKVETIRQKCGSKTKDIHKFRQLLRVALDALKEAEIIRGWLITHDDFVLISREPSATQREHLTKKAAKAAKKGKK